ncbi:hypothetical protein GIB67_007744 [Kingdonia uniflora]|uniref:Uncharacterized protein n=1 Tax=Kingdonia uniflora TaxID=39325 RepID=A0A7J7N1U2_9MAGN|nr:hypothetical protein GIB67_007744 [Kingdonia uniflora]
MKSDKEVNEQVDNENQTQEGGAKKSTSNAKNYASRCIGVGLHKMFAVLPKEEMCALRTSCFVLLLLIKPIATMSTLVVDIFDRHLCDLKFQFGGMIIQMKPIHVCLILELLVSHIANKFLFVNPERITNFKMRRFPKKKKTYGLKEIDGVLKHAKLERYHDNILRLNLLKNILSFLLPKKGRSIEVKYADMVDDIDQFNRFPLAMKASETDMQQELVQEALQVTLGEGLEAVKDLMVDDDVEVGMEVNLKTISSEYGSGLLEWKTGGKKDNEDEKDVEEKVKFIEEEQLQVAKEEEVHEMEEWKNGDKKVDDVEKDGAEKAKSEEEQPQVAEEEDSEQQTVVVYYNGKKDVQHANEVAKIDIVFFNHEKVVGEAYQTKESKEEVKQSKDKVVEGKDDDDKNSQKKPDHVQLILMELEVDVTLKMKHTLTDKDINERAFKMACQMNQLHAHLDELLPGVLLKFFIQIPISQDKKN